MGQSAVRGTSTAGCGRSSAALALGLVMFLLSAPRQQLARAPLAVIGFVAFGVLARAGLRRVGAARRSTGASSSSASPSASACSCADPAAPPHASTTLPLTVLTGAASAGSSARGVAATSARGNLQRRPAGHGRAGRPDRRAHRPGHAARRCPSADASSRRPRSWIFLIPGAVLRRRRARRPADPHDLPLVPRQQSARSTSGWTTTTPIFDNHELGQPRQLDATCSPAGCSGRRRSCSCSGVHRRRLRRAQDPPGLRAQRRRRSARSASGSSSSPSPSWPRCAARMFNNIWWVIVVTGLVDGDRPGRRRARRPLEGREHRQVADLPADGHLVRRRRSSGASCTSPRHQPGPDRRAQRRLGRGSARSARRQRHADDRRGRARRHRPGAAGLLVVTRASRTNSGARRPASRSVCC